MPVLLVLFAALLGAGFVLFQVGRASGLSAEAQTAADAAAIAGARSVRDQLTTMAASVGYSDITLIDESLARSEAEEYAQRNGATVVFFDVDGLKVTAEVATNESLGEDAESLDAQDVTGNQRSTAELDASFPIVGGVGGNIPNGGASAEIGGEDWKEFKEETSGTRDIVAMGRFLQEHGFTVAEHPSFGGVCSNGCHAPNSWHYRNGAIDVNVYPAGAEMAALDKIDKAVRAAGYNVLWRVEDHFDHMHIDIGAAGPDAAAGLYGPASFDIALVETEG